MALSVDWYLVGMVRLSTLPGPLGDRRGFGPAVLKYIPRRRGQWIGGVTVTQVGAAAVAVTYDDSIVRRSEIMADRRALAAAPDDEVFHLGVPFDRPAAAWTRREAFKTAAENRLVDGGRLESPTASVRGMFRQAAKHLMLYNRLGLVLPQLGLDQTLEESPRAFRDAFKDRLLEMGVAPARLVSDRDTMRALYRRVLQEPFLEKLAEGGAWKFGRADVTLKKKQRPGGLDPGGMVG